MYTHQWAFQEIKRKCRDIAKSHFFINHIKSPLPALPIYAYLPLYHYLF